MLKDFVTIAGPLGVTHFMIFSKTQSAVNMVGSDARRPNMISLQRLPNHRLPVLSEAWPTPQRSHAVFQGAQGE